MAFDSVVVEHDFVLYFSIHQYNHRILLHQHRASRFLNPLRYLISEFVHSRLLLKVPVSGKADESYGCKLEQTVRRIQTGIRFPHSFVGFLLRIKEV